MSRCQKCHGLILEPNITYGYAGEVCHCAQPASAPAKGETLTIGKLIDAHDEIFRKPVEMTADDHAMLRQVSEEYEAAKGEQKTLKQAAKEVLADLNAMPDDEFAERISNRPGLVWVDEPIMPTAAPKKECGCAVTGGSAGSTLRCPHGNYIIAMPPPSDQHATSHASDMLVVEPNISEYYRPSLTTPSEPDAGEWTMSRFASKNDLYDAMKAEIESLKEEAKRAWESDKIRFELVMSHGETIKSLRVQLAQADEASTERIAEVNDLWNERRLNNATINALTTERDKLKAENQRLRDALEGKT